jgi:hypothetical protein
MYRIVPIIFGLAILVPAYAYTTSGNTLKVTRCSSQTDLQNAINNVPSGGTVTFACGTPSSPAVIPVTSTVSGNALTLTLEGNGAVILSGAGASPILQFTSSTVTMRDFTITGAGGGAIRLELGTYSLTNATLYNNSAVRGGGVEVEGPGTTLTVINSTFSGNSATQIGNDLNADIATINLENSILLDGCYSNGGTITDLGGNLDTGTSCIANNLNGSLVNVGSQIVGSIVNGLFFPLANGSAAINFDTANCPSRDELGNPRSSTCTAGAVEDNTPPAGMPTTPLPNSLWLILAGLAVFGIYSMWPSRMWTRRSP